MRGVWVGLIGFGIAIGPLTAADGPGSTAGSGQALAPANLSGMASEELIQTVIEHESEAANHRGYYMYESVERSERTGGHEWTEHVAETKAGKVRFLIAEDSKPLTGQRLAAERARIEDEGAHPDAFQRQEATKAQDEQHMRNMLRLLPHAFLFDPPQPEGEWIRVRFRPNPAFQPSSLEERVLHAMTGSVLIDPRMMRTRELEGRLPQDVNIGFGILATVHAGSNFATTREHAEGADWKTETVHTDLNGKALFLKTLTRKEDARHWNFHQVPSDISVADAVKLLETAAH